MRCVECKHWKTEGINTDWEAAKAGFGECRAVLERWRIMDEASSNLANQTDAEEQKFETVRIDALKSARAYVQDGSEYRAELLTAPDFFCALFTQK